MLKIGAALIYGLSVLESILAFRWLCQARENNWEPRRIFYAITCYLNALMQCMMANQLWKAAEEEERAGPEDFDELED